MSMSALNIPSDREIRQINRNNKKNVEQQRVDREKRLTRRNELRSQISSEVSQEIKLLLEKADVAKEPYRLPRTRSGRIINSFIQ